MRKDVAAYFTKSRRWGLLFVRVSPISGDDSREMTDEKKKKKDDGNVWTDIHAAQLVWKPSGLRAVICIRKWTQPRRMGNACVSTIKANDARKSMEMPSPTIRRQTQILKNLFFEK